MQNSHRHVREFRAAAMVLSLALASPAWAYSVKLDFSGDICSETGLSACADGDVISQSYGDITGVLDVSYGARSNSTGLPVRDALNHWEAGFSNSTDVVYADVADAFGQIVFTPLNGTKIWLTGIEIGGKSLAAYTNIRVNSQPYPDAPDYWFTLWATATLRPIDFPYFNPVVFGNTRPLALTWGNALNSGVDSVTLEVSPVPEPSSVWMGMASLGLLGAARLLRQRRGQ